MSAVRRLTGALARASAVACLGMASVSGAMVVAPASAAGVRIGPAEIVSPQDTARGGTFLAAGGSATPFSLRLPDGAACAGDSADGGHRVQSYMVPESVDPVSLIFRSNGPLGGRAGGSHTPLYRTSSSPFVNEQTATAENPGEPGLIVDIPAFSLAVHAPGDLPPGVYNVGIACTLGPPSPTQLQEVWNTKLTVVAAPDDRPAGLSWIAARAAPVTAPQRGATAPDDVATPTTATAAPAAAIDAAEGAGSSGAAAAAEAPVTDAGATTGRTEGELPSTGAPPTLSLPVVETLSSIRIATEPGLAMAMWLAAAAAFVRIAYLLRRMPTASAAA